MAVSSSNLHAPNKATRFVGICIQRLGCGLRANFTLRNVIKHVGKWMFKTFIFVMYLDKCNLSNT